MKSKVQNDIQEVTHWNSVWKAAANDIVNYSSGFSSDLISLYWLLKARYEILYQEVVRCESDIKTKGRICEFPSPWQFEMIKEEVRILKSYLHHIRVEAEANDIDLMAFQHNGLCYGRVDDKKLDKELKSVGKTSENIPNARN